MRSKVDCNKKFNNKEADAVAWKDYECKYQDALDELGDVPPSQFVRE
jgi:hypothetical protein